MTLSFVDKASMAANERTALIQIVPVAPPHERYPHRTLRRTCTLLLSIIPILVVAGFSLLLFWPGFVSDERGIKQSPYLPWSATPAGLGKAWPQSDGIKYQDLQKILIETPDPKQVREWSKYYTSGPHLAGKNLSQAIWTKERWEEWGVKVEIVSYDVYVNYPLGHRLALLERKNESEIEESIPLDRTRSSHWKIKYEAKLEEDVLDEDATSSLTDRIPTFHGYSASGNVTAPYVFVNYGTYQDFEDLLNSNVSLQGKIALAKYGHIFRGLKVKRAQDLGMVGVVIYSDPGDDGNVTELNGNETYPHGPARNPSSVQRGSVQFLSLSPGDPTTPGYPSKPGVPRQPVEGAIPSIPSIPISYQDALPLLTALNGHGPNASAFDERWQQGGLGYRGVNYNIGPTSDDLVLNLVNEQEYITNPMWNVIGVINGTISDEVVILGNHRDAWIAGGAGDPNSGSAALNEVIRSFGKALEAGWKPLRTVVLASWDGEEYGLIGSTEWVEEFLPWLSKSAVAYLNVDVGTRGPYFKASAAPLLNKALTDATHLVVSPNQTVSNQTVGDVWDGHISTMGSGSDFTAFQDFAGIPSIDMGFSFGPHTPIYHYHSNYDSFSWMDRFGDPGFKYHATIAKIWGVIALNLIESPVLPLNATDYSRSLESYLEKVKRMAKEHPGFYVDEDAHFHPQSLFAPLTKAIGRLQDAANNFDAVAADLAKKAADSNIPWWKWWEKVRLYYLVRRVNTKYKVLERQFLYQPGLDGRNWFKHVVFAPGLWTGYAGATFPGLIESIDRGDTEGAFKWAGIITGLVEKAVGLLEG